MTGTIRDKKMCSIHQDREIVFACLYMGCTQPFLCRKCFKEHSDDHENDIQELSSVQRLESRLNNIVVEKDRILRQQQEIKVQKDNIVSLSKELITTTVDKIIKELQDKKQELIGKLLEHANTEKDDNTKNLFLKLENDFKEIKDFRLSSEDIFDKITQAKVLNEEMLPQAKNQISEVTKVLETWKLDNSKFDFYEKELSYLIQNLQFQDYLSDSSIRSLMDLDIPDSLKTVHQNLGLKSRVDVLNEENAKLRKDNECLNRELQEIIQAHNQTKLDNIQMQNQANSLNQENQNLKNQNLALGSQNNTLKNEKNTLETDLALFNQFKNSPKDLFKALYRDTSCGAKMTLGDKSLYFCKGSQNGCNASGKIWGSNPYTSGGDSCVEARHSGVIGTTGGVALRETFNVTIPSFLGTVQNGIISTPYGGGWSNNVKYYAI